MRTASTPYLLLSLFVATLLMPACYSPSLPDEPFRCALGKVDLGGDQEVVFNGFGVPDSGGAIVVRSGDASRTVDVEAQTGRTVVR